MEWTAIASVITAIAGFIVNHFFEDKKLKKQIKKGSGKVIKGSGAVVDAGHATAKVAMAIEQGKISGKEVRQMWRHGKDAYQAVDELLSDESLDRETQKEEIEKQEEDNG